jgi:hypothetical protein
VGKNAPSAAASKPFRASRELENRRNLFPKTLRGTLCSVPLSVAFWVGRSATSSSQPSWLPSWLLSSRVPFSLLPFAYSPFSMGCIDSAIVTLQLKNV